ncbi:uncharacterized protein LOC135832556 isoform X2 [Planococcus citri]|uniref:uncharacterized protein LOC135832556 isoform X2 n=1 Tax=Planococcus citri TaxID=170843 RepID=UPI0031F76019
MTSLFNTLKQLAVQAGVQGEDTKMQFSMKPNAGESGFQQWHSAMKMVARLPGGIPHEFRKTLWLTLAERHISSRKINWNQVERTCFNDTTNPDDEELGVQIVKDLHRTGCSLFCGTSGEQNQAVLKRVLLAYARWNKSVGYCQGFNMLAALILEVMDRCEYDSLKVMIYLIEGVLPESYFANSLRGLSIDMAVFRDLLRLKLPELSKHLEQLQTGSNDTGNTYEPPLTNVFTMQWFLTLFCNCLPHSTVLRVWDLVFLEGNQVLLKTALAIWDTLSDRIMPVKSADEFYTVMGVLTREMLEFGLMDANSLIKTITSIELSELTELRERYIYNITPWTQVARKGLRLFYSDDEMDDSDEEQNDDKVSEGAYGFLKAATKHGSQSIRSISPSSILSPFASEKEKIALDISALKKQYSKIKERQRQAQIIFTAACNTHGLMGSMVPSTQGPAINHLLVSKPSNATKNQKPQKQPPISRAVQRLKESSSSIGDETSKDRGETVYWDKRTKKKRRRRRAEVVSSKTGDTKETPENNVDSDSSSSSSSSYSSASMKSSTSTELCDDMTEFDSDNTSLSEYGSSPVCRLQSPSLSFHDEDKPSAVDSTELAMSSEVDLNPSVEEVSTGYNEGDNILNVLLTTSILVSEQMNQQESVADTLDEQPIIKDEYGRYNDSDESIIANVNSNEFNVKIDEPKCDTQIERYFQRDTNYESDNVISAQHHDTNDGIFNTHVSESLVSKNEQLETALEHMKIDALEILFSTSTLESIRNESIPQYEENFANFDVPVIVTETEKSFEMSPVDKFDREISQLTSFVPHFDDQAVESGAKSSIEFDNLINQNENIIRESNNTLEEFLSQSYHRDDVSNDVNVDRDEPKSSYNHAIDDLDLVKDRFAENNDIFSDKEAFSLSNFQINSTYSNESSKYNDLLDFSKDLSSSSLPAVSQSPDVTETSSNLLENLNDLNGDREDNSKIDSIDVISSLETGSDFNSKPLSFDNVFDNNHSNFNSSFYQSTETESSSRFNEPNSDPILNLNYESTSTMLPTKDDYNCRSYLPECEQQFAVNSSSTNDLCPDLLSQQNDSNNLNNTETALRNILRENTEVLKRVYKYASSQSCDFDSASSSYRETTSSDGERDGVSLPRSRLKTKDIKFLSLDYPSNQIPESKKRPRRKHKSLDSLNTKKSKLKIGLVSKNCKWISISIDNSDLAMFNIPSGNESSNKSVKCTNDEYTNSSNSKYLVGNVPSTYGNRMADKSDKNSSEYLHLNFDIIGSTTKKKKDPIQEYVNKKNTLSQSFKSPNELAPLNFNPFPSRSNNRPPKELGVKLGLYSSNKTK